MISYQFVCCSLIIVYLQQFFPFHHLELIYCEFCSFFCWPSTCTIAPIDTILLVFAWQSKQLSISINCEREKSKLVCTQWQFKYLFLPVMKNNEQKLFWLRRWLKVAPISAWQKFTLTIENIFILYPKETFQLIHVLLSPASFESKINCFHAVSVPRNLLICFSLCLLPSFIFSLSVSSINLLIMARFQIGNENIDCTQGNADRCAHCREHIH